MTTTTNTAPSNDNAARWTSEAWRAHVEERRHAAHIANSYALHREEMGRLAPAAKVIAAQTMRGMRWTKDSEPLTYDQAIAAIDAACARRAAKRAA